MKDPARRDEYRRTLAWLDDALEGAHPKGRTGLVEFLDLVRTEILFDMAFSERPPSSRGRTAMVPLDSDAVPGA